MSFFLSANSTSSNVFISIIDSSFYLEAALEDGDYDFFLSALDDAVHALGVNAMAKKMGVNRQSLYKSFNKGSKPNFETVFKAINSLGLRLSISHRGSG